MDIIEYVNEPDHNQYTLHSSSECTLDKTAKSRYSSTSNDSTATAFLGDILGTQCQSSNGANAGCAFTDTKNASAGSAFNKASGGVFAHLWDNTQVSMLVWMCFVTTCSLIL